MELCQHDPTSISMALQDRGKTGTSASYESEGGGGGGHMLHGCPGFRDSGLVDENVARLPQHCVYEGRRRDMSFSFTHELCYCEA